MRALNLSHNNLKNTNIQEETQIIAAAVKDPNKFAPLYQTYYKRVFLFLLKRCGDEDLAADLCSQTFLKAINNLKQYNPMGFAFSAWLYRIAYNEFLLHHRSEKCKRAVYAKTVDLDILFNTIEDQENEEERRYLLKKGLSKLKEDELLLIEMKYFEHKQYSEISDITGLTVSNLKVKVHRIIKKLNRIITS